VSSNKKAVQFGIAIAVIVLSLSYLAFTGVQESKSYYVTIGELQKMEAHGDDAYVKRLRVAGNVKPGSIERHGAGADFVLLEQGNELRVSYKGAEPPPDTFKDDAQALAEGTMGKDGVFHAKGLQAKCASKYAPKPGQPANGMAASVAPPAASAAGR
jgi:cytochrome c-type biogenesis protein CcmE